MTGHSFKMEFKILRSKSETSEGIINHKNTDSSPTRSTKTANKIEKNIIKEAKFYSPKLTLGKANFVDRCLSNTARELMYTRTGRRSGVMPWMMLPQKHQRIAHYIRAANINKQ